MTDRTPHAKACSEPGCKSPGLVQVKGNKAWFCFSHKPVGKMK